MSASRAIVAVLLLTACAHTALPPPPLAGSGVRSATVAIEGLDRNEDTRIVSDGETTYVLLSDHIAVVDWRDQSVTTRERYPSPPLPTPPAGAKRWQHGRTTWILAHGDELAYVYEEPPRVEIVRTSDGRPLRSFALADEWALIADSAGFDGDSLWYFRYDAGHENPSDHMLGTPPRPATPALCSYEIYDTRHDRRQPIRTEHDALPGGTYCTTHAIVALPSGGVQVLSIPADGELQSTWYDRAP